MEIFKDIFKGFQNGKKLGDGRGAGVVSTKIGKCAIEHEDGDISYTCVEKIFASEFSFQQAIESFEYVHGKTNMKDYFPDVFHIDREQMSVHMAFFSCQTLAEYFYNIDIFDKSLERSINGMFLSINDILNALISNDIYHGDLHTGNVLACLSEHKPMFNLKVIDLDECKPIEKAIGWKKYPTRFNVDEKGHYSKRYMDSSTLSSIMRKDILNGVYDRLSQTKKGNKKSKMTFEFDIEKQMERIEDRLHEFSNLGKLALTGYDRAEEDD